MLFERMAYLRLLVKSAGVVFISQLTRMLRPEISFAVCASLPILCSSARQIVINSKCIILWGKWKSPDYIPDEIISFLDTKGKIKPAPYQYVDYFFYFFLVSHCFNLRGKMVLMLFFCSCHLLIIVQIAGNIIDRYHIRCLTSICEPMKKDGFYIKSCYDILFFLKGGSCEGFCFER